jgi:methylmalonyl-CoA mutase
MSGPPTRQSSTDAALAGAFAPATREQWLALVEKALEGASFEERLLARTADGLKVQPLYTRSDAVHGTDTGLPGAPPFTRGTHSISPERGWDIRQLHAEPDPAKANAAILEDISGGATSITLQVAAPGQFGVPYTGKEMASALRSVDLGSVPVVLNAGEYTVDAAGSLMALWQARGIAEDKCVGAFSADPLGTLARTGALYHPIGRSLEIAARLAADSMAMPKVTALAADGHIYHAAGASEAQELAAMLATLVAYLRAMENAGIAVEDALPKVAVSLAADTDQFLTIAKLRAARRVIWRVAEAAGAGQGAARVHVTAVTAWRMLAKRDPWVNLLRTTMACAAGAMGGADAILVFPFTWALGRPGSLARRIARNTHLVLSEEAGFGRVLDPAGGSWYVEKLTNELSGKAWGLFQQIEAKGGMGPALSSGYIQDEIAKVAEARARKIATGQLELTGVSAFPLLGGDNISAEPHPLPLPADLNGAMARPLRFERLAEPFERLRDAADIHQRRTGQPLRVFMASLGPQAEHGVRTTWVQNFLAAGGIDAPTGEDYSNSAKAAAAFAASDTTVAVITGSDQTYAELAEATAMTLKGAGAKRVYLAGRPGALEAALKSAGVDGFLFPGQDAVAELGGLHEGLG